MDVESSLVLDGALLAANGLIFAYVARALWTRDVPREARRANTFFTLWWASLAFALGVSAAERSAAALGALSLPVYVTAVRASLLVVCAGIGGLLAYLSFLLTGKHRLGTIGIVQAVLYGALTYYVAWSAPDRVEVSAWSVQAHFARAPSGWPLALMLFLLVAPAALGALGYFSLYFRVRDASRRYRIAMVSGSILGWLASALLAGELQLTKDPAWTIASRLVGIAAALTILIAYRPPEWVRRRLAPNAA